MSFVQENLSSRPEILVAIGFLLTFAAFVVSDILWLRILTIVAKFAMAIAALLPEDGPMWLSFSGNMLLIAVNLFHSTLLIMEKRRSCLSDDEQFLKDIAFPSMERVFVKRLFSASHWTEYEQGETLLFEGECPDRLFLLFKGKAFVSVRHRRVGEIGVGQFAGEMSFLTMEKAGATVTTRERTKCLVWERSVLEKLYHKDKDLQAVLMAAIGTDLATKILMQNRRTAKFG
ncbi:cyclic nucleotide-binding domain-containing protein [Kiloniella sp. EL199]|uniref:cyclic nucleotide-binding domain-containing protein n=1 Tax=Kiloniella sp. EL199 TaxID=2107581 RepID=UPI000EA05816|nr:cyclic nucleotide-binding domain-containing protein [Kiloniella sp. EL199]